ncbi:hypothetical protein ACFL4E_01855 [Candidatus Omnitrophota bacterium]
MTEKKEKYTPPAAYDLTSAVNDSEVYAANCTSGTGASGACSTGFSATKLCQVGGIAAQACASGTNPNSPTRCKTGGTAVTTCGAGTVVG